MTVEFRKQPTNNSNTNILVIPKTEDITSLRNSLYRTWHPKRVKRPFNINKGKSSKK